MPGRPAKYRATSRANFLARHGPAARRVMATEIRLNQTMLLANATAIAMAETEHSDGDDDDAERTKVRPHWRRAHWRRFAVGRGRAKREYRWVPAVYVNKHRLIEAGFEMGDTIVEVRSRE